MKKLILALICLLLTTPCSAEIIVVDDDWPYDFDNIQDAIDYSTDYDTIMVFPGTYTGEGNRNINFLGKAITVQSVAPEFPSIVAATIIDCNEEGGGFHFISGENADSILDGLTITNCRGPEGGGIRCRYNSNPTITNCIIRENSAFFSGGGGIYCFESSPTIANCTISGNTARDKGGGLYCQDSSPTISNCTITNNRAVYIDYDCAFGPCISGWGGGIYCDWSTPKIINCTISGNSAPVNGGGIYCINESYAAITNCILSGNSADSGGGIYCQGNSSTMLTNATISGNSASSNGGGIYYDDDELGWLTHCILWGNTDSSGSGESAQLYGGTLEVIFSCIQDDDPNDGYIPGEPNSQNIDDNPMFVRDPNDGGDGWGDDPLTSGIDEGANDDFGDLHLQKNSPCIDAGLIGFSFWPDAVDIDGQERIMGGRIDMGADEFEPTMIVVTRPQGGEVWVNGSWHKIEWDSYGVSGTIDISYSSNNGAGWVTIDSNVGNTGSYMWHLPDMVDSNQCLVSAVPSVPDANFVCIESGLFTIGSDFIHPAVPSKWKSLGDDFDRSGLSENYGPEVGCTKWQFETDGPVSASVTVGAGDRVHIACEDGKVYTLDSNGSLVWSYATSPGRWIEWYFPIPDKLMRHYEADFPLVSSPTVGPNGSIYVGSTDGKLYAISIGGGLRWTHTTDGAIYSSPAVSAEGNVYVCSQDGRLYALAQDGSELWSFETGGFGAISGSIFASPATGDDGTIYIAGLYDPNLYALDPNNGSIKWACRFDSNGWPFASPVVATDGTIYQMLVYDTSLYAIEPNNGTIIWSTDLADPGSGWFDSDYADIYGGYVEGWSEPVLGPDGTIYVSLDEDPYLRAVDPNGSIKWVTKLGFTTGFTLAVGSDGLIYAAGDNAVIKTLFDPSQGCQTSPCDVVEDKPGIYVIDPNGQVIAQFQSSIRPNFPVIGADNILIISDANTTPIGDVNNIVMAIVGEGCEGEEFVLHRSEDLSVDGAVNFVDFALLAGDWLDCTDIDSPCDYYEEEMNNGYWNQKYLKGDIDKSLYVDFEDIAALANRWLNGN